MRIKRLEAAILVESLGQVKPRVSKGYGVTTPMLGRSRRPSLGLNGVDPDEEVEYEIDDDTLRLLVRKLGGSFH